MEVPTSNFGPSCCSARFRLSFHIMPPSGYASTIPGRLLICATCFSTVSCERDGLAWYAYASACSIVQPFTWVPSSSTIHGVIELISRPMSSRSES